MIGVGTGCILMIIAGVLILVSCSARLKIVKFPYFDEHSGTEILKNTWRKLAKHQRRREQAFRELRHRP